MMPMVAAALGERLDRLQLSIDALQRAFDERLRYDEVREQQVAKLYDELDSYKRAEQDERVLDLARGLFLVLDKIDPVQANAVPIELVRDELLDCLAAVGIETIVGEAGTLDPLAEQVVGFLDDPSGDDSSRIVADGYRMADRVVRPRRVMVHRAQLGAEDVAVVESATTSADPGPSGDGVACPESADPWSRLLEVAGPDA